MTAVRVVVRGEVQGVFFRASTRDVARDVAATGWVRNDPEGTVTMVVQGDRDAVDHVLAWVRDGGPPQATVTGVDVSDASPDESLTTFTIRR